MNILALFLGLAAGVATGLQGGINSQLTVHWAKNSVLASAVSFTVGALALWVVVLALQIPVPSPTPQLHWYHFLGGVLGAYFVFSQVYLSARISAAAVVAILLAGQIVAAVLFDHYGIVGYKEHPATLLRFVGLASLAAGVMLITLVDKKASALPQGAAPRSTT